jgi:hypothetical protein
MDQSRIDELLLYCLRVDPGETGDGGLEALSSSDWDVFIATSGWLGVAPLLYHRLRICHPDVSIPANVMGRLRQAYLENAARNVGLYHRLGKLLELLRRDNISVIVLKGAHLAELVYGNWALRSMCDVDLLVHRDDLMRVEAVLLAIGYTPLQYNRTTGKDNKHFGYILSKRELYLEVHWAILPSMYPFDTDISGQWERSQPATIAGYEVAVLCPEDLLLHLCLHACEHRLKPGLRNLCDICETLRHNKGGIDWELVQLRTRQRGMGKCVYITLRLARELLGVILPDGLEESLKPDDFDERFMALAREQVFSTGMGTGHILSLSPYVAKFWGSKRLLDKPALFLKILKKVFPPREVMAREYPLPSGSIRIYFYYAMRFRELLQLQGHHLWRLLRGDEEMQALAKRENEIATLTDWLMSP